MNGRFRNCFQLNSNDESYKYLMRTGDHPSTGEKLNQKKFKFWTVKKSNSNENSNVINVPNVPNQSNFFGFVEPNVNGGRQKGGRQKGGD